MKTIYLILLIVSNSFCWEINTHRAIDRIAIEKSKNLKTFISSSGISENDTYFNTETFDGYGKTYLDYAVNGEGDSGISQWTQIFSTKPSYQKMIEAGTILEDAMWQGASFSRSTSPLVECIELGRR